MARDIDLVLGDRIHCLELGATGEAAARHIIGPLGLKIGRTAPADIVLADSEVSRSHCLVALAGDEVWVSDLNSTNGTFVDGVRVNGKAPLPIGATLQVGKRSLKHEWRSREEIAQSEEFDRELQRAASYVEALLPPRILTGEIRADWHYLPSARLGGDAFGYGQLSDDLFVGYLIDVAGHGAGAAMHAVTVINQLRQRALPGADMTRPAEVLAVLNRLFQMDDHANLYFTIWYGVYDRRSRKLDFAGAGHHPAFLVDAARTAAIPVGTRNAMIGAVPGMGYKQGSITVAPGASLHVFSDGVFEIVPPGGPQWALADFLPLLQQPPVAGMGEPRRLYEAVRKAAGPGPLDDDFCLVTFTFD